MEQETGPGAVAAAVAALRAATGDIDRAARDAALDALARGLRAEAEAVAAAIDADFGGRARIETMLAEIGMTLENIRWTRARLGRWMAPRRVRLAPEFWPSRARVERVPLGVVGILSPWNYPVQLALLPLVAAIAGGNRVLLRPSEHTPRTAALLARIVEDALPGRARVVTGGPETAQAVTGAGLDGLFYTGGAATGRRVMAAAAESLTPVTLELGGKCPAIVLEDADLERTARSIMAGKLFNAGQTCVAPDYVLAPRAMVPALVEALRDATAALYPDPEGPDYTAIARPPDRERLVALVEGRETVDLMAPLAAPKLAACAVIDPDPDSALMTDEIFGPVLPIVPVDAPGAAVAFANARPCPLALYVYGRDRAACEGVVAATRSGGAMIGDSVIHVSAHALPFGGAGESGMGAYHGEEGFRTFTRPRSVMRRARFAAAGLARPPYGRLAERIAGLLLR